MAEKKYNFEDERSVADLIGSLPRVEAPTNFDARVRSRIAQGRPTSRAGWLMLSAAAASLCAVVLTAMVFVYFRGPDAQIADATQPEIAPVIVSESPSPQFALTRDPEPSIINNAPPPQVVAEKGDTPVRRPKTSNSREGAGSYRIGVEEIKAPIMPIGISTPGATPETNVRPPGPVIKVSAREVLQMIGLEADFRDGGWLVKKVAETSLAGRSGVRDGDIIEAIDDVKVTGNTTFENGFNGKNLTVLRNGSRQTISLQNR